MAPTVTKLSDITELFGVEGLVAVVTGGGTGIGLMMARALENNGAIVYIVGRRTDVLEKAVEQYSKHGNMIATQGDVASKDVVLAIAKMVKTRHGYINLLVNNAGVIVARQPRLPTPAQTQNDITQLQDLLWDLETPDSFQRTFDVNVAGVWYCTVAFLELLHEGNKRTLREGGSGVSSQVLTVSSAASLRKDSSVFGLSYTLSKAAATHLGKLTAHYLKDWKIRSNVICPGVFHSEMVDKVIPAIELKTIEAATPVSHVGSTDDMAGLVLYLASKAGAYVDGGVHVVDGGGLLNVASTF